MCKLLVCCLHYNHRILQIIIIHILQRKQMQMSNFQQDCEVWTKQKTHTYFFIIILWSLNFKFVLLNPGHKLDIEVCPGRALKAAVRWPVLQENQVCHHDCVNNELAERKWWWFVICAKVLLLIDNNFLGNTRIKEIAINRQRDWDIIFLTLY